MVAVLGSRSLISLMVRQHWHVITISCPANCRFLALAVGPGNAMHPYVVQRLVLQLHCWSWRKLKLQYSFVKLIRALTGLLPFNLKSPFSIDLGEEEKHTCYPTRARRQARTLVITDFLWPITKWPPLLHYSLSRQKTYMSKHQNIVSGLSFWNIHATQFSHDVTAADHG